MIYPTIGPKYQGETKDVIFDFSGDVDATDSITSVDVLVTVHQGVDASPNALLVGLPTINGFGVVQRIHGGVRGVTYKFLVTAHALGGTVHIQEVTLFIR